LPLSELLGCLAGIGDRAREILPARYCTFTLPLQPIAEFHGRKTVVAVVARDISAKFRADIQRAAEFQCRLDLLLSDN
jgi:hypothetical protein